MKELLLAYIELIPKEVVTYAQEQVGEQTQSGNYLGDNPNELLTSVRRKVENKLHWMQRQQTTPIAGLAPQAAMPTT